MPLHPLQFTDEAIQVASAISLPHPTRSRRLADETATGSCSLYVGESVTFDFSASHLLSTILESIWAVITSGLQD